MHLSHSRWRKLSSCWVTQNCIAVVSHIQKCVSSEPALRQCNSYVSLSQIATFSLRLVEKPLKFAVYGDVSFNHTFLYNIFACTTTYFIVLLQFELSEKVWDHSLWRRDEKKSRRVSSRLLHHPDSLSLYFVSRCFSLSVIRKLCIFDKQNMLKHRKQITKVLSLFF